MELALNLAWVVLAVSMVVLWLRLAPEAGGDRRIQFVALALVVLVLLPAISMTDDLIAASNPAEIDTTTVRRDHDWDHQHFALPALAALVVAAFSGLSSQPQGPTTVANETVLVFWAPALSSIANRPPPAA